MTLARPVELPVPESAGTGLLDLAGSPAAGWERGVTFSSPACLIAGTHIFCSELESPGSPAEKQFQSSDVATFSPFGVEVSIECSALGPANYEGRRAQALAAADLLAESPVGLAMATGLTPAGVDTGNPSLADAVGSGAETSHALALGALEDVIADTLSGQRAVVHVAPSDLVALAAAQAVRQDLSGWVTPGGHRVIASAGYTSLAGSLFATTDVFAALGGVDQVSTVDLLDNTRMAVMEAAAIVVFDPCFNVSVDVTASP